MDKISVAEARKAEAVGRQVRLQGWVRTRRDSKGGFSFIELNDGSCQGNVQVVAPGELLPVAADIAQEIAENTAPTTKKTDRPILIIVSLSPASDTGSRNSSVAPMVAAKTT